MSHAEQATQYCLDVLDGRIIAGNWIRLAARRHLDDLAKSEVDPEYPYAFYPKKANRICRFAELCPHIKGTLARRRERIRLEPWQKFCLGSIFGWVRKSDGLRRFRTALLYVPRKNGKSLLASIIGLYMLAMDGEAGAEILCGATSLDQANFVFRPAQQIVERTVGLRQLGITVLANALVVPATGSKMISIIGQPPDGSNPSCGIVDEVHEHVNDLLISTLVTGMGSRDQPLLLALTTAGYNSASPGKLLQDELTDVLSGHKVNDELFGLLYTCDEVDWKSELALRQANPNMGVSVNSDFLLQQQREAIASPRKQTPFRTKHLNQWCSVSTAWLPLERWNACYDPAMKLEEFEGQDCWAGLDLANKLDLTAYCKLFRREIEGKDHYYLFPRFYLPEARVNDIATSYYQQWHLAGWLEATPGSVNSHEEMREDIEADARIFSVQAVGHDPWGASQLIGKLTDEGISCVEVGQTWKHMSAPMKELEALVIAGQFHHDGNPVMAWNVANCKARSDRLENIVPDKESPERKIDGVSATIIGLSRALLAPTESNMPSISFL
jgi:phage terminase large subunit-like protein